MGCCFDCGRGEDRNILEYTECLTTDVAHTAYPTDLSLSETKEAGISCEPVFKTVPIANKLEGICGVLVRDLGTPLGRFTTS